MHAGGEVGTFKGRLGQWARNALAIDSSGRYHRAMSHRVEEKPSAGQTSFVPFMLLAAMSAFVVGSGAKPFQLTRPAVTGAAEVTEWPVAGRRLWEDPFHRVVPPLRGKDGKPLSPPSPQAAATASGSSKGLHVCVTLPGEDTHGAREFRLRTRYAVQAALTARGYTPEDAENIQFRMRNSVSPNAGSDKGGHYVPFEEFRGGSLGHLLRIVWIDERAFSSGGPPGTNLANNVCDWLDSQGDKDVKRVLIGPTSSYGLACLLPASRLGKLVKWWPSDGWGGPFSLVYSPWATRYDVGWRVGDRAQYTMNNISRWIADDRVVAKALVSELLKRGVDTGCFQSDEHGHPQVLLVLERDSDYAKDFNSYLMDACRSLNVGDPSPKFEIAYFSRSLDGLSASDARDSGGGAG